MTYSQVSIERLNGGGYVVTLGVGTALAVERYAVENWCDVTAMVAEYLQIEVCDE